MEKEEKLKYNLAVFFKTGWKDKRRNLGFLQSESSWIIAEVTFELFLILGRHHYFLLENIPAVNDAFLCIYF